MTLWTEEQDEALRDLHDTASFTLIAAAINQQYGTSYSRNAVIGRARRLGLECKASPARAISPGRKTGGEGLKFITVRAKVAPRVPVAVADEHKPKPIPVASLDVRLVEIGDGQCRFACTRVDDEWRFCGHPVKEGGSWCPDHHALVWSHRVAPAKQKPIYRDEKRRAA